MKIQINLIKIMRTGLKENVYAVVKYLIVGELAIDFAKVVSSHLILKIKFFLIKSIVMTFKKKLPTIKKKTSKLELVRDILMPLSTIKNNSSCFKLITKEE
jgi:hypothetical protein